MRPDPEASAATFPKSDRWMQFGHPMGAVCSDGAVWFVGSATTYFPAHLITERGGPDVTYCQLTGPDGTVLLPTKEVWSSGKLANYSVQPYDVLALPDGSAAILIQEYPVNNTTGPTRTRLVHVNRRGRVSSRAAECPPTDAGIGRSLFDHFRSSAGPFWHVVDSRGRLHVFQLGFMSRGQIGLAIALVHLSMVRPFGCPVLTAETHIMSRSPAAPDSIPDPKPDLDLVWLSNRVHADMALLGDKTLLVVGGVETHKIGHWMTNYSDSLRVQRYRLDDLELLYSHTLCAAGVAGWDWTGIDIAQAVITPTDSGYAFLLPAPDGARSFVLDPLGNPVAGLRDSAQVADFDLYPGGGSELVDFRSNFVYSEYRREYLHRDIEYIGLDRQGHVYYRSCSVTQPPVVEP